MSGSLTLAELHSVLQNVLGWTNSHLHRFDVDGQGFSLPAFNLDDTDDESKAKLRDIAATGSRFRYDYDFGDGYQAPEAFDLEAINQLLISKPKPVPKARNPAKPRLYLV